MRLEPIQVDPRLQSPLHACDAGGVTFVVGSSDAGGYVVWASDGRGIALDPVGPPEGQRSWSEVLALPDGALYLHGAKHVVRGTTSLSGGFAPCSTVAPFSPFAHSVLAANEHGVWLGGQDGFNSSKGFVALAADGTSFQNVVTELEAFVHRVVPWGSAILVCAGKSVVRVDPRGATPIKSFRSGAVDVWAEGQTIVVVTPTDLSVSRNGGKSFKAAFKFARKLYGGERRPVAFSRGVWLASADGCRFIRSTDAMSWEPVPDAILGSIDHIVPTSRGFLVIGRGDTSFVHELAVD